MQKENPFERIALCLSGGGYRAAAFHFGAIDMLRELKLRENVKMLSTVSGGTIIGAYYAQCMIDGRQYDDYYRDFFKFLKKVNAVDDALLDIYNTKNNGESDGLSVIRSAADIYNTHLFKDKTFESPLNSAKSGGPFTELIYNTTDFRSGQSFRFRASQKNNITIGSADYRIPNEVAGQARLADIVAASSCFPSVFEPIRFPDDFLWPSISGIRNDLKSGFRNEDGSFKKDDKGNFINIPLMDGGIFDNQGIDSMMVATITEKAKEGGGRDKIIEADLFIVSDSSPQSGVILEDPPNERGRFLSILGLWWGLIAVFLISLFSLGYVLFRSISQFDSGGFSWWKLLTEFGFYIPTAILYFMIALGILYAFKLKKQYGILKMQGQDFHIWESIKGLTIKDVLELGKTRISSLIVLSANIFLRRIRIMQASALKSDEDFSKRVAFSLIYDLSTDRKRTKLWEADPDLEPSAAMKQIAIAAGNYPTNLWFDTAENMRSVITCGQISLCLSLLKYLIEECGTQPNIKASPHHHLYAAIKEKWMKLKENPYAFYRAIE